MSCEESMQRRSPRKDHPRTPTTFFDRIAIAFGSAVVAFITGCIVWLTLAGLNRFAVPVAVLPSALLWWFTGLMAVLGFFRMENLLAKALARAWDLGSSQKTENKAR
jgi:hypothetical protein